MLPCHGMLFVSLVVGSVELGDFALCLPGIIYGFFIAFWVWIMNFNNKQSLVCSLLVMLRWVGCFWMGHSLSVLYSVVLPSVCWALLIVSFVVFCVIALSSMQ